VLKSPPELSGGSDLLLQALDLSPLVVELVALVPHGAQQLGDALLLALDHLLVRGGTRYNQSPFTKLNFMQLVIV